MKCEVMVPTTYTEDTGEKKKGWKNHDILEKCGKPAKAVIRCMYCCSDHYRTLRTDNERRFKWDDETVAYDCTLRKRKKDKKEVKNG